MEIDGSPGQLRLIDDAPDAAPEPVTEKPLPEKPAPEKRKRGRPKGSKTRAKAPVEADGIPATAESPATEQSIPLEEPGWFSAAADAARTRRAEKEAAQWLGPAKFAVRTAEAVARGIAKREAVTRGGLSTDEADARVNRLPMLREVPMTPEGSKDAVTCEDAAAQALAIIAAYFAPPLLSHPLAQASFLLAAVGATYSSALRATVGAP